MWLEFKRMIEASGREVTEKDRELFMACDSFQEILLLIANYVDDDRTIQRVFSPGARFVPISKTFRVGAKDKEEDLRRDKDLVELTQSEVLKARNSISPNLNLTMEVFGDFHEELLPTLDFELGVGEGIPE